MTREEFSVLVKGMRAVFTQTTFIPDKSAFDTWYMLLGDLDYTVASAAIQKYMVTNKFPPTPAEIREIAAGIVQGETPDWSDGWEQVLKLIRKYGSYNQAAAMNEMDDLTRQTVERLGFLELCMSEKISVDRANFRDIYNQLAERKQKAAQLPPALTNSIKGLLNETKLLKE